MKNKNYCLCLNKVKTSKFEVFFSPCWSHWTLRCAGCELNESSQQTITSFSAHVTQPPQSTFPVLNFSWWHSRLMFLVRCCSSEALKNHQEDTSFEKHQVSSITVWAFTGSYSTTVDINRCLHGDIFLWWINDMSRVCSTSPHSLGDGDRPLRQMKTCRGNEDLWPCGVMIN